MILTVYFLEPSHILPFIKMSDKSSPLKFFSLTFRYYMYLYNQRPYTIQNICTCNGRPFSFLHWFDCVGERGCNSCLNSIFMFNLFDTHFFETFIKNYSFFGQIKVGLNLFPFIFYFFFVCFSILSII